ncbi:MAG: N-acetylmuramoyl-L-alanine amidase-like domain-containing protein [Pseudomonadota bacterium]
MMFFRIGSVVCLCVSLAFLFAAPTFAFAFQFKYSDYYQRFYDVKKQRLEHLFASEPTNDPDKIIAISGLFLDLNYVEHRLIGSSDVPEQLVIDFGALDCFTYLDYVEALRKSSDYEEDFIENLIVTRYVDGEVSYLSRKHFFSDWVHADTNGDSNAHDVTALVSDYHETVFKDLNRKADGSSFIPDLPTKQRYIDYIPSEHIDATLVERLQNGDYIGIYSEIDGLDVTHVGIFLHGEDGPVYRNASSVSSNMRVVDSPFLEYMQNTPGIVVYRAHFPF